MELTAEYLNRAEVWLLVTLLVYYLMNGAQLFETTVIIPKWTSSPPDSLKVLQGKYAPDLKTFWIAVHSVHELTFIAAIGFCWQITAIRNGLVLAFLIHFAVRVWTIVYFAPAIMSFQNADTVAQMKGLTQKVQRWRRLNYLRVGLFFAVSFYITSLLFNLHQIKPESIASKKQNVMEQRLSVITLGVDNLATQQAFYEEKLGWLPVAKNKDIVFFKLNGFLFSLLDRKTLAKGSGVSAEGSGFRALTISYNVSSKEEVDKLCTELKAKGVKILAAPQPTPFGGYFFTFADPENNVLEVAYNPYTPMDDAGNVITHKNIDNL